MEEIHEIHGGQRTRRRVALLDSDSGFVLVLGKRLERAGWDHVPLARKLAPKRIAKLEVDALVVDVSLLGAKPNAWLLNVCELRPDLSVIVCAAGSSVAERVIALRSGVDDWLAKPCHPEELVARLEGTTMRRRHEKPEETGPTSVGELEIRPDQYQAFADGRSLRLTRREYQLLRLLVRERGQVLTRERIYECLWGYEMIRNDRSVDVFVHKLRRKIELGSPGWAYIHTHFGIGYRLAPERVPEAEPLAA